MSALLRALIGQTSTIAPPGDIVKDGLVFRLNGMNQGGVDNTWIDEVGGLEFKINSSYGYVRMIENGAQFLGRRGDNMECKTSNLFPTRETTIEICADVTLGTSHATMLFSQGQPDNERKWSVGFTGAGPNQFLIGNKVSGVQPLPGWNMKVISGIVTNSLTENTAFQNDQSLAFIKNNSWAQPNAQVIRLGENIEPGSHLKGIIYEIRIYNRILTDEERKFNYLHDKKTYLEAAL